MERVVIVYAAVVSALGPTLDRTWQALMAGESAIGRAECRFGGSGAFRPAACIPGLRAPRGDSALAALTDRLLEGIEPGVVPGDSLLYTATTKAGIDVLEQREPGRPGTLAPLFPGDLRARSCRRLGLEDRGFSFSAACASSTAALARAAAALTAGRASAVLVVAADLVSTFVSTGFAGLKALSETPCRPFDSRRDGLSLGEGAAALLLMTGTRARAEGRQALAGLAGWAVSNDAAHVTAPDRSGAGLARAMDQALRRAGLDSGDIGAVNAHGTGTVFNDAMELAAFARVFGPEAAARGLVVHTVKGALGHTLGAAGAIEAALAIRSLAEGQVPPTLRCEQPDFGADGLVFPDARAFAGKAVLSVNSGFGGINGTLVFTRGDDHA